MKHRFRPHLSVSLPPGIINAAITNKKTVMTVCTPCTVVSRSVLMSVIITFMFEPAKLQMNWASASGTNILRSEPGRRGDERSGTGFARSHDVPVRVSYSSPADLYHRGRDGRRGSTTAR